MQVQLLQVPSNNQTALLEEESRGLLRWPLPLAHCTLTRGRWSCCRLNIDSFFLVTAQVFLWRNHLGFTESMCLGVLTLLCSPPPSPTWQGWSRDLILLNESILSTRPKSKAKCPSHLVIRNPGTFVELVGKANASSAGRDVSAAAGLTEREGPSENEAETEASRAKRRQTLDPSVPEASVSRLSVSCNWENRD